MAEEQDPDVPDSLKSSIYAAYIQGMDIYEMYESLWIPAKYTEAIDEMWESWEEEDKKNPPQPGVARMIPTEWPSFEPGEADEESAIAEADPLAQEQDDVLLDTFRRRFGNLYDLYQKGTQEQVVSEIMEIYLSFKDELSIRENFNGFLRSACKYLSGRNRTDVVGVILSDLPAEHSSAPDGSVERELSLVKERNVGVFLPGMQRRKLDNPNEAGE
jgi:hypothetical protein